MTVEEFVNPMSWGPLPVASLTDLATAHIVTHFDAYTTDRAAIGRLARLPRPLLRDILHRASVSEADRSLPCLARLERRVHATAVASGDASMLAAVRWDYLSDATEAELARKPAGPWAFTPRRSRCLQGPCDLCDAPLTGPCGMCGELELGEACVEIRGSCGCIHHAHCIGIMRDRCCGMPFEAVW